MFGGRNGGKLSSCFADGLLALLRVIFFLFFLLGMSFAVAPAFYCVRIRCMVVVASFIKRGDSLFREKVMNIWSYYVLIAVLGNFALKYIRHLEVLTIKYAAITSLRIMV